MSATLLLVDDDPNIRDTAVDILEDAGYGVMAAGTAQDALAVLAGTPVDLLITDLNLPDQSGTTLAREVRSKYPKIKIIMLSGQQDLDPSELQGLAEHVLLKPLGPQELLGIIKKLLDQ